MNGKNNPMKLTAEEGRDIGNEIAKTAINTASRVPVKPPDAPAPHDFAIDRPQDDETPKTALALAFQEKIQEQKMARGIYTGNPKTTGEIKKDLQKMGVTKEKAVPQKPQTIEPKKAVENEKKGPVKKTAQSVPPTHILQRKVDSANKEITNLEVRLKNAKDTETVEWAKKRIAVETAKRQGALEHLNARGNPSSKKSTAKTPEKNPASDASVNILAEKPSVLTAKPKESKVENRETDRMDLRMAIGINNGIFEASAEEKESIAKFLNKNRSADTPLGYKIRKFENELEKSRSEIPAPAKEKADDKKRGIENELEALVRGDKTPETRARMDELEKELAGIDGKGKASEKVFDAEKKVTAESIESALLDADKETERKAERLGIAGFIRNWGERYKKIPLWQKAAVTVGIVGAGIGLTATGFTGLATVAMVLGSAQRALGGAALFQGLEEKWKKTAEAKHEKGEKGRLWHKYPTAIAAAAGILVASGAITGIAKITPVLGEMLRGWFPEFFEKFGGTPVAEAATEKGAAALTHVATKGETVWGILKNTLGERGAFEGMSEGQRTYVIDALKDKLAAMSAKELQDIGISSGDVNTLALGDTLKLDALFGDDALVQRAMEGARGLSQEAVAAIDGNNKIIAEYAALHSKEMLTEARIKEILGDINKSFDTPAQTAIDARVSGASDAALSSATTSENVDAGIPREVISAQIVAQAEKYIAEDIDEIFGSKGFFGFGGVAGIDSPEWRALRAMPAEDIAFGKGGGGGGHVAELRSYLGNLVEQSGVRPSGGETVEKFALRASVLILEGKTQ